MKEIIEKAKKLGYTKGIKIKSLIGNTKGVIIGDPYLSPTQNQYVKINVKTTFGEEMPFIIYDGISNKWADKL
jgi:hypothetical protein